MKWVKLFFALTFLLLLTYFSDHLLSLVNNNENRSNDEKANLQMEKPAIKRDYNPERIANGKRLFLELCFMCHGKKGEGAPDWKTPGEDGRYPAPPLNGTGHAWHHPMKFLHDYIKNGSVEKGGGMTGFGGALSDMEIEDIILWFQSRWPDELYDSWYRRDLKSKESLPVEF
ncbi:hypothetical protein MNBD_NITROSPINAE04-1925 [hydrothermal vent metagenome]|uniref:Cytochrome c domain-containing protein n=1 Tax=hydrothermal vent metagenome TaxID=652676 RepID=A0A3B1DA66_9ZZZZ